MSTLDPRTPRGISRIELALLARRAVVVIAASSGLYGIMSELPVLSVVWRVGTVAVIGLCAIHAAERASVRLRGVPVRSSRGGKR